MFGLPPLLIQVGENEIPYDDAIRIRDAATTAGVDVAFESWRHGIHVWPVFISVGLPESAIAIEQLATFLETHNPHSQSKAPRPRRAAPDVGHRLSIRSAAHNRTPTHVRRRRIFAHRRRNDDIGGERPRRMHGDRGLPNPPPATAHTNCGATSRLNPAALCATGCRRNVRQAGRAADDSACRDVPGAVDCGNPMHA
jgi:hypothetical protein